MENLFLADPNLRIFFPAADQVGIIRINPNSGKSKMLLHRREKGLRIFSGEMTQDKNIVFIQLEVPLAKSVHRSTSILI